ncbi:MAG: DUF4380 domain-containing protein, partial [Planctomycetota bacterium]
RSATSTRRAPKGVVACRGEPIYNVGVRANRLSHLPFILISLSSGRRMPIRRYLNLFSALLACLSVHGGKTNSWAQAVGPVTLANGHIRLTVNPSVGRVVDFGKLDGPNLMRITDPSVLVDAKEELPGYQGYGGDQLWPAQQATWGEIRGSGGGWPPLNELDGPRWQISGQGPLHVTIKSPESPLLGLVVERRFELSPDAAHVAITNKFTRAAIPDPNQTFDVQIWSVTGIVEPDFVLADISPERTNKRVDWVWLGGGARAPVIFEIDDGNALRFNNRLHGAGQVVSRESLKFGAYGDWLAAIYEDSIFLQTNRYDPSGHFPDGASLEIYSSQKTGEEYVELETLSTSVDLALGESLTNRVDWRLLPRDGGLDDDDAAQFLRRQIAEPSSAATSAIGMLIFLTACRRQILGFRNREWNSRKDGGSDAQRR